MKIDGEDCTWFEIVISEFRRAGWVACTQCHQAIEEEEEIGVLIVLTREDDDVDGYRPVRRYRLLCRACRRAES